MVLSSLCPVAWVFNCKCLLNRIFDNTFTWTQVKCAHSQECWWNDSVDDNSTSSMLDLHMSLWIINRTLNKASLVRTTQHMVAGWKAAEELQSPLREKAAINLNVAEEGECPPLELAPTTVGFLDAYLPQCKKDGKPSKETAKHLPPSCHPTDLQSLLIHSWMCGPRLLSATFRAPFGLAKEESHRIILGLETSSWRLYSITTSSDRGKCFKANDT